MSDSAFLKARGIRKSFGQVEVLHGVDLNLAPGTVTALLGENGAGKSTLVRILAGDYQADGGTIDVGSESDVHYSVAEARRWGIRLISQEISDAPTLTVAENVVLGEWPRSGGLVDRRMMRKQAGEALAALGADLDLDAKPSDLRLGERQLVEIARATRGESKLVIFDEPTAALSDSEARQLYKVITALVQRGVAILYITHRLDEVFSIAHRVCVMRDGVVALDDSVSNVDTQSVVESMVGHVVDRVRPPKRDTQDKRPVLELTGANASGFRDINLTIREGEILGVYGKVGSGVTELGEVLFGVRPLEAGAMRLDGKTISLSSPSDAIGHGIGYLPPDRAGESAFLQLSVGENVAAPSWTRLAKLRTWVTRALDARAYRRWHDTLRIRSRNDPRQPISTLSGGNQQKVLLGRWLEAGSRVLVLSEPTRGVDIGAREEIYSVLRDLAMQGTSLIIVTSDYEDVVGAADTAIVLARGQSVARFDHDDISIGSLTEAAGGKVHA